MEHLQGSTLSQAINLYYIIHFYYDMGYIIKPILQKKQLKHREANDPSKLQQLVRSRLGS